MWALVFAADSLLALESAGEAERCAHDALRRSTHPRVRFRFIESRALRALAGAALGRGGVGAAVPWLERARAVAEEHDNPGERARVQELAARVALFRGEKDAALAHAQAAFDAFVALGNGRLARQAAEILGSLGVASRPGPAGGAHVPTATLVSHDTLVEDPALIATVVDLDEPTMKK
jgi:hypothetical protein